VSYACGLRRSELVHLDLADYTHETGELRIRVAKGGKQRIVYVQNGALDALEAWLDVRGREPGPLFCAINKGGTLQRGRASSQLLWVVMRTRGREAGLNASTSPHDLRRSFISDLLDASVDLVTVQKLAGHANVTTTAHYDRRSEATKKQGAAKLHVPYRAIQRGQVRVVRNRHNAKASGKAYRHNAKASGKAYLISAAEVERFARRLAS
jgi:site-specific recombinase XerD